jgi:hypothetical protein
MQMRDSMDLTVRQAIADAQREQPVLHHDRPASLRPVLNQAETA